MESFTDQVRAFVLALLFHLALIGLIWWSAYWILPQHESAAAGEPIQATLQVSAADIRRAKAAIKASPKLEEPKPAKAAPPQPVPEPKPQTADTPLQMTPQAPQDRPDTVDQQRITKLAQEKADQALQEQEQKTRQDQVDLTEDIARQQLAEKRQRLREYMEIQREREAASKTTRMEEQKLQQLADLAAAAAKPVPHAAPSVSPGDRGPDKSLLATYMKLMKQTADENWNHVGAQELTHCQVHFTQRRGGEVMDVDFLDCPFSTEGREFVERALKKTPMPYSGFESVFERDVKLDFCYPMEECAR
jgi:colicin import membrane protein